MGEGSPPSIEDTGRDGYDIRHLIDTVSDDAAWAWFLAHACHSIVILPDEPLQSGLDPVEGCGDTDAPTSLPRSIAPFHDPLDSEGTANDP